MVHHRRTLTFNASTAVSKYAANLAWTTISRHTESSSPHQSFHRHRAQLVQPDVGGPDHKHQVESGVHDHRLPRVARPDHWDCGSDNPSQLQLSFQNREDCERERRCTWPFSRPLLPVCNSIGTGWLVDAILPLVPLLSREGLAQHRIFSFRPGQPAMATPSSTSVDTGADTAWQCAAVPVFAVAASAGRATHRSSITASTPDSSTTKPIELPMAAEMASPKSRLLQAAPTGSHYLTTTSYIRSVLNCRSQRK